MKNKKATHVGFILSFVIFIFALVVLYTLLQPDLRLATDKTTLLNYLERELKDRFSVDLTTVTLSVNKTSFSDTCFQFIDFVSKTNIDNNIVVQNEFDFVLTPYVSGNDLYVDRTGHTNSNFFKISVADEFSEAASSGMPNPCQGFVENSENGYIIGLVRTEKYIFQSKIIEMINSYYNNYDALKTELNVPLRDEFGFDFVYENETVVGPSPINTTISIYANDVSIRYVDTEANKKSGSLRIRVW